MSAAKGPDDTLVLGGKSGDEPHLPSDKIFRLIILEGKGAGRQYQINKWTIIIGRDASVSDLVIDDPGASRSHACLEYENSGFVLEDLESTNGITLNNRPVTRTRLKHGDKIGIGKTVMQFVEEAGEKSPKVYELDSI